MQLKENHARKKGRKNEAKKLRKKNIFFVKNKSQIKNQLRKNNLKVKTGRILNISHNISCLHGSCSTQLLYLNHKFLKNLSISYIKIFHVLFHCVSLKFRECLFNKFVQVLVIPSSLNFSSYICVLKISFFSISIPIFVKRKTLCKMSLTSHVRKFFISNYYTTWMFKFFHMYTLVKDQCFDTKLFFNLILA